MRTLAILPVKSFRAAKQRLAEALGAGSRVALAQAMFVDVLTSARRVPGLNGIAVARRARTATRRPRCSASAARSPTATTASS
jgi:2-phospho-L-lactate guanylyltransferase (CobY/MobA/RfbA family)